MNITLIKGDGIGQEISRELVRLFEHLDPSITFETFEAGEHIYEKEGYLISPECFESLEKNKIGIKGPITTPIGKGFRSINVQLRKKYDLFANVRPIRSMGSIKSKFENINLIIFRENTEDLYAGVEEKIDDDTFHSIKIITRKASERIIRQAFEYAKNNGIDEVTVVTKANIMKLTDGLFLEVAREVQKHYPEIQLKEVLIDNMCMQLVMNPHNYHVIVTENLYGDILSDLCAGLVGGLGLIPGANIGEDMALFEAVHGSAPDIAGKNIANPTALFMSAYMMLNHIGKDQEAKRLLEAIEKTLSNKDNFTRDLGGTLSTTEYTDKIIEHLKG